MPRAGVTLGPQTRPEIEPAGPNGAFGVAASGAGGAVVIAAASAALVLAVGAGAGAKLTGSGEPAAGSAAEQIATSDDLVRDIVIVPGQFRLVDDGIDGRRGVLPVTFTNRGDSTRDFRTTIEATGRYGQRLGVESLAVQDLVPGETTTLTAFGGTPAERMPALLSARFLVIGTEGAVPFEP